MSCQSNIFSTPNTKLYIINFKERAKTSSGNLQSSDLQGFGGSQCWKQGDPSKMNMNILAAHHTPLKLFWSLSDF